MNRKKDWLIVNDRGEFAKGKFRGHFDFTLRKERATRFSTKQKALAAIDQYGEEGDRLLPVSQNEGDIVFTMLDGYKIVYFCHKCGVSGVKLWKGKESDGSYARRCWRCLEAKVSKPKNRHRVDGVVYDRDVLADEHIHPDVRVRWWENLPL